jgi:hypothetical protein
MLMKALYCLILLWALPGALLAQSSFVFPKFETTVRSVDALILPRWSIRDSVSGDLNRDGRKDMALVLEYADTVPEMRADSMENTAHPRILLVLLQDSVTGGYRPVCQNNTFILRTGEGGMIDDPYGSIGIRLRDMRQPYGVKIFEDVFI